MRYSTAAVPQPEQSTHPLFTTQGRGGRVRVLGMQLSFWGWGGLRMNVFTQPSSLERANLTRIPHTSSSRALKHFIWKSPERGRLITIGSFSALSVPDYSSALPDRKFERGHLAAVRQQVIVEKWCELSHCLESHRSSWNRLSGSSYPCSPLPPSLCPIQPCSLSPPVTSSVGFNCFGPCVFHEESTNTFCHRAGFFSCTTAYTSGSQGT